MNLDDGTQPQRSWLNWTTAGTVAGVLACVILLAALTVGWDRCSHKEYPVICLLIMPFR